MQEFKENDKDLNTRTWVIVEGLPDLRENQDYMKISNVLEESAKMVSSHGSKKEAICYIPHEKTSNKYSEDVSIDNCALIQFGTEKDAMLFSKRYKDTPIVQKFGFYNLRVYTWKDLDKYDNLPDKYPKMGRLEFQDTRRNLLWWLLDQDGDGKAFRDQFVIRYKGPEFEETNVFWMDENQTKTGRVLCYDASELKDEQKQMTEQYVQWSPNGYYLLTTHPQGVQLWGGPQWQLLNKLKHERVDQVAFSPNETFLITCNEEKWQDSNGEKKMPLVQIWDVFNGDLIISVPYKTIGPAIKLKDKLSGWWPIFKWSSDEKYIAKINSSKGMGARPKDLDKINIFEVVYGGDDKLEDRYRIQKLGGKSLTVDSLFSIEFSPTDNVLAYTTFAQKDDQAKVSLISIPSKNSLKHQSLGFDVKKAHLYWQSQGRYLAINMGHSLKATSIQIKSHSIGIMTVKDRNMPFSRTDKLGIVTNFAWEPDGSRYAVIHGGTKRIEPNVTVFQVQDTMHSVDKGSSKIKLTLQKRRMNQLHWAPKGGRLVVAHVDPLRRAGGELEFVDLNRVRHPNDDSQTVKGLIHENMTDIEWDPSGRYLITATTQHLNTTSGDDTRYIVWSYQGEKLYTHKIKYFYQILWRPRPTKLLRLTHQDRQKINAGLTQNGWDKAFKDYDNEQRHKTQNVTVKTNLRKLKLYNQRKQALEAKSKDILARRERLRGTLNANYITKTLHERLEKNKVEYVINVATMKKILNEEIDDFDKWRQQQQGQQ